MSVSSVARTDGKPDPGVTERDDHEGQREKGNYINENYKIRCDTRVIIKNTKDSFRPVFNLSV